MRSFNVNKRIKKIEFVLFLLVFLIPSFYVKAQNPNAQSQIANIRNVTPPSPNASALGRFGEVPVSYSTGIPDISIPLYELTVGKLKIPISINYHSGGFKVNENASWVGLGWALNAGGVISRSRIGFADENNKGYLNSNDYMGSLKLPINLSTATAHEYAIYESLAYGQFDTEPDIFSFNFLGRSGRFFFDPDGNIHQLNYTDLKIKVNPQFTEWTITDEAGTVYTFSGMEYTDILAGDDLFPNYVSAWHLNKIKTANNEIVNFSANPVNIPRIGTSRSELSVGFSEVKYSRSSNINCEIMPPSGVRYNASSTPNFSVGQMESDEFVLRFNADPNWREDGGSALGSIELYDKKSNQMIKKYQFSYGYFTGGLCMGTGMGHEHNNPVLNKRLKLNSVTEFSRNQQSGQVHKFYYNESVSLPAKCSYSQDHWGYSNGAYNTTLIPHIDGYPISSTEANRESDSTAAKAAILTKIVYPTGGSSVFEHESNKIQSRRYIQSNTIVADGLYSAPGGTESTREFSIPFTQYVRATVRLWDGDYPVNISPQIYILDHNGSIVKQWYSGGPITESVYLATGDYTLKLVSPDAPNYEVSASIEYVKETLDTSDRVVGGLRIKSITNYDADGTRILSKRRFSYEKAYLANDYSNNNDYRTNCSLNQYADCAIMQNHDFRCDFDGRASYANYSAGTLGGSHILYGKVTELNPENGKSVYEYSVFTVPMPSGFPQAPASLNDWKSGQLLKKTVYKENNQLVKRDIYDYDYVDKFRLVNYKIGFVYDNYCHSAVEGQGQNWDKISAIGFENLSGFVQLKSHKEITYTSNALDSVQTATNFYYDNPLYSHSNRTEVKSSEGEVIKTLDSYPQDNITGLSSEALAAKNTLVAQYRIKDLLEKQVFKNNAFLSKTRINYSNQWSSSNLTLPKTIEVQQAAFDNENRVRNYDYDPKGNLLSQSKEGGPLMGYHWIQGKQRLIAEIKNASDKEFYYEGFEDGEIGTDNAHTGTKSTFNPVVNWTAPNNRVYVITYWYMSEGGAWKQARDSYNTNTYTMHGGVFYDDIMIYPADAEITTYTYEPFGGLQKIQAPGSITLTDGFFVPAGKTVRIFTGFSFKECRDFTSTASADQNYISTKIFKVAGVNEQNINVLRSICEVNQTIQYFDGLGRPLQTVAVQGSPGFKDIIQPIAYDVFGRENKKYLPYTAAGSNGTYRQGALGAQTAFYNSPAEGVTAIPGAAFSETKFEASPLNRIEQQGAPGSVWQPALNRTAGQGRAILSAYETNISQEVKRWTLNSNGATAGFYLPGTLYKTVIKDENWVSGKESSTEEFKDFEGRIVLKRLWKNNIESLSTYYVYDDFGNLRYVLPPALNENTDRLSQPIGNFTESDPVFEQFIYAYHYDGRNRVTEKKIPGKGWEYMVYNPQDWLVLSQDAKQRSNNQWLYNKYDALGRVLMSGLYTNASGRAALQATVNGQTIQWESRVPGSDYSNEAFPKSGTELLTVNYYHNYEIPGIPDRQEQNYSSQLKGLLTAAKVKVLGSSDYLWTINYYDDEARVLKSFKQHYKGGELRQDNYDEVENTYSFAGELTFSTRNHHAGTVGTSIATRYEYDHMGRKKAVMQSINGAAEIAISKLVYNEVGQLNKKYLHSENGTNFLQYSTYAYNPRGWLKSNTSDQFSFKLEYDTLSNALPQYNGNIAAQRWGTGLTLDNGFTYTYDPLNRLKQGMGSGPVANGKNEALTYDVMGNILTLNRDGASGTYNYTGNRLNQISGGLPTGAYAYDENGNAITDGRNGVSIAYNNLNLPSTVSKAGLSMAYTYDATGAKLRKASNGTSRDYIDGIEYDGTAIDIIHTGEGVARRQGSGYSYEYNLTDHLGNVRYTFYKHPVTGVLTSLQSDDYYPFGKRFAQGGVNKYLYNGKELQQELGQLDYGARFYDPVIGRWNVVDPLAELDRKTTPYAYAFDDPIRHTDPDGMFGEDVNDDFDQEDGPKPKAAVSVAGATTVGGAIWRTLAAVGEGIEIVGTGAATAVFGTVALVFLPTEAGRGSDRPPRSFLPPPPIAPKYKDDAKADAQPGSRSGQSFTPKEKQKVVKANEEKNGGKIVCEGCKVETTKPEKSKKGVTPPKTDRQVDHKKAKSKGGSGTAENGQVLCRDCNVKKSNN
eukprot:gene13089-15396_t